MHIRVFARKLTIGFISRLLISFRGKCRREVKSKMPKVLLKRRRRRRERVRRTINLPLDPTIKQLWSPLQSQWHVSVCFPSSSTPKRKSKTKCPKHLPKSNPHLLSSRNYPQISISRLLSANCFKVWKVFTSKRRPKIKVQNTSLLLSIKTKPVRNLIFWEISIIYWRWSKNMKMVNLIEQKSFLKEMRKIFSTSFWLLSPCYCLSWVLPSLFGSSEK